MRAVVPGARLLADRDGDPLDPVGPPLSCGPSHLTDPLHIRFVS